ncbi:hypothetical protein [Lacticaseibacillus parakribbianus]|uniref:hypothetical protein n=1 Tax=Lacticaseibacillus parakribbianus TaxID=2970927 RepID=UPI0021CAEAA6|nr:hypothetical protein [Lacticaseibacillus parakribbianus]
MARSQLAHLQQAQIALMRKVYAALDAVAPEHLVIAAPTQLRLLQATPPDNRPVYQVDAARLGDPQYQAALLATITPAANWPTALPLDPRPVAPSQLTPYRISLHTSLAQTRPRPQRQRLRVTVQRATTTLLLDDNDHTHAQDGLLATVEAATAVEKINAHEETFSGDLHLTPHVPVVLAFDAALIRLQLSLGWQGGLTGRLRLARAIAPNQVAALRRARAAAVAAIAKLTRRQAGASKYDAGEKRNAVTDQNLGVKPKHATDRTATPRAHTSAQTVDMRHQAASRTTGQHPPIAAATVAQLATQLQAGRLTFAAYQAQIAALLPPADNLVAARQAVWDRYLTKREALSHPVYLLAGVSAHDFADGGAMMRQLAIDPARLKQAAYRHRLFTQWRQNAKNAVW